MAPPKTIGEQMAALNASDDSLFDDRSKSLLNVTCPKRIPNNSSAKLSFAPSDTSMRSSIGKWRPKPEPLNITPLQLIDENPPVSSRDKTRLEDQNPEMFPKSFGMSKSSDSDELKSVDSKVLESEDDVETSPKSTNQSTLQKSQIELFAKNREIEKLQERIQDLEKTQNEQKTIKSLSEEFEKLKIAVLGDQEPSESARIEELEDLLEESDAKILDLQEELEDVKAKMFEVETENHHLKIERDELGGELQSENFRFSEKLEFAYAKIKAMDSKIQSLRKDSDEKIQKLKHSEFKKVQEILKLHHRLQTEDFDSDHKFQESLKILENQKNLEIAELKDMLSNQGKRFQLEIQEVENLKKSKTILEAELQKLQKTLDEKDEESEKWAELDFDWKSFQAEARESLKMWPAASENAAKSIELLAKNMKFRKPYDYTEVQKFQKTLDEKKGAEPKLDLKALQESLRNQMEVYLAHPKNARNNSQSSSKS
ncbi:unnamed protein product [Caenorhabditis nigoni]